MESAILLIIFCRAIGLCNLRYVPKIGRFKRDNGPMLLYWVSLHLVYILLMPCIIIVMVWSFFHCRQMDMLAVAYSIVCLAKTSLIFLLLSRIWLQRCRWQRLGNGFLAFQQLYRRDRMKFECKHWLQNLWKTLLSLSRVMLLIHLLFGPGSLLMCDKIDKEVQEISSVYIFLSVIILPIEMIDSLADYWIYYMMDTSNWVLDCMSKAVHNLKQDIRYLPQPRGCHRVVYLQQLVAGWQQLWSRCMRMERLIVELLDICKWQILLNLFTNYVIDITIIFNLVIYSNGPFDWNFIGYFILCILFHWDLMSYFSIFEINHFKWTYLLQQVQKLWLTLSSMDIDWHEDIYCIALYRQLEFAVIFLNRKLQQRPDRVRRLHIAGLFDMNRKSGYCMSTSIVINVLILWQIAYKYYY